MGKDDECSTLLSLFIGGFLLLSSFELTDCGEDKVPVELILWLVIETVVWSSRNSSRNSTGIEWILLWRRESRLTMAALNGLEDDERSEDNDDDDDDDEDEDEDEDEGWSEISFPWSDSVVDKLSWIASLVV